MVSQVRGSERGREGRGEAYERANGRKKVGEREERGEKGEMLKVMGWKLREDR